MSCKMNCQAFSSLLQQCGNRNINIIENVCCLELKIEKISSNSNVEYICSEENYICIKQKNSFPIKPATYIFLVDKNTINKFSKFLEETPEKDLEEKLKKLKRNFENCNKKNLFDSYHHYFPLYVGKTENFCNRYKHFKNSLKSGATAPHVFGGNLNQFLSKSKLINSQPMKMCLVAFYTNSKDKAECIEHFILKHTNFCKIFNDEDGDCPKIQEIKRIAKDIKNEAQKINNKSQEIIRKAEEIKDEIKEITEAEKTEDIKKSLETIKKKAEAIIQQAEEIINAIQIADDIIKTIQKLKSCP